MSKNCVNYASAYTKKNRTKYTQTKGDEKMGTVFRIPKPEKRVLVSLRMDKKNLCEITKSAKKIGISRNEWIVQAIEYAINSMEQEENVGKTEK